VPLIPFGEWKPDISDYEGSTSLTITGVLPRADGYGPMKSSAAYSQPLPGQCRGAFCAYKTDGSVTIFAATATNLYVMNNNTGGWITLSGGGGPIGSISFVPGTGYTNGTYTAVALTGSATGSGATATIVVTGGSVSSVTIVNAGTSYRINDALSASITGGTVNITVLTASTAYSALPVNEQWQFAQFNNFVIAVASIAPPQMYNLTSPTNFVPLGGVSTATPTMDNARYISIIGRFVVMTGFVTNAYRVRWSGLNDPQNWTSGINNSDYQDLPDGGVTRGVAGGESGLIFQDNAIRRMTWAPGSDYVFLIERISQDKGIYAPYSVTRAGERIFFLSNIGFHKIEPGTNYPVEIGKERFDRFILQNLDRVNLQLVIGAADPRGSRVFWSFRGAGMSTTGNYTALLCYDYAIDRATIIPMMGEYLLQTSQPGTTLEGLDGVTPGALLISATPPAGVTATAAGNSGVISAITFVPGSGYTSGTYLAVALTGGAGSGATANIVVDSTGVVASVTMVNPGSAYAATNSLSASITGGSVSITVSSVITSTRLTIAPGASSIPATAYPSTTAGTTYLTLDNPTGGLASATLPQYQYIGFDSTHVDLVTLAYSGSTGTASIGGALEAVSLSLDSVLPSTAPDIAQFDTNHQLAFFGGPPIEAILDTSEQGTAGQRLRVRGLRPITDAQIVLGSCSHRENLRQIATYTNESQVTTLSQICPLNVSTRYSRARIRIPVGTTDAPNTWTYAVGVEPYAVTEGLL
jgi:hypothetical protein